MQDLTQTLHELEGLHERLFGCPAPKVSSSSFIPFPAGVDPVEHVLNEVRDLEGLAERVRFAPRPEAWIPPADSFLGEDALLVQVDLSGISREDIEVHVVGRECIVRGERKPAQGKKAMRPNSLERPSGFFERRFVLPMGSRADEMKARYVDGVLELTVPVESAAFRADRRTIEIG